MQITIHTPSTHTLAHTLTYTFVITVTVVSYAEVHYSALTPHMHPPPHDEVHRGRRGEGGKHT